MDLLVSIVAVLVLLSLVGVFAGTVAGVFFGSLYVAARTVSRAFRDGADR